MYLRTTKRKNRDGSVVVYYQLAHNERHPETKVSTPRVIHNFGRADLVERDELVRLCRSIAKVCGLVIHDPVGQSEEPPFEAGLPKEVKLIGTVELGPVVIIEALWLRLGIGQVFKAVAQSEGCKESYERALLAMTANRLCEPQSKLGVWERWLSQVFLPSCDELKLADMYEAMDLFHKHCNAIEQSIFFATADLLIWMSMWCFTTPPPPLLRWMKPMGMMMKRSKPVYDNWVVPRRGVGKCKWSSPWR